MKVGYVIRRTQDESIDLQLEALKKAGCQKIYTELAGLFAKNRPVLEQLLEELQENDVLIFWKLNRFANSIDHLVKLFEQLHLKKIHLKSLSDPIDTTISGSDIVFKAFKIIATIKKSLIRKNTLEGLKKAKNKGRKGGRPKKKYTKNAQQIAIAAETLYMEQRLSTKQICRELNIQVHTYYSYLKSRNVKLRKE